MAVKLPKLGGRAAAKVAPTGTSYSAQGLAAPQLDSELGSSQPVTIPEIVPDLSSPYVRLQTYTKMQNDATVDVSVRAAKTPVLGADFFVIPASNNQDDLDTAEFISANLFEGMLAPFLSNLDEILDMIVDGYTVLEKVYENRQWAPDRSGANGKNYTMLKKLAIRPASTIKEIDYDDNGEVVSITQSAIQADKSTKDAKLDASKVLVFTFRKKGGDVTGRSILRTAYPHWFYKTHFYKIDAIQKERHSLGVPKGKLLPGYNKNDRTILRNLVKNLRNNEEAFMVLTPNVDVEFAEIKTQLVNVLESADHHNVQILLNVMVQFLAAGIEGNSGGRSSSGAQTDIYMKAMRYVANLICDIINMFLIPELVVYNFKTNRFPKLQVRNMGETRDLQMLGSGLANLYSQGALTTDLDTENWVRSIFDMPPKHQDTPGVDPNAKQQNVVTLYDASGNAISAIPVNGNGNAAPPTPPTPPQKGATKQNGGQGNVGKPVNAAQ